jgi:predicted Zn-dependent protease
MLFRRHQITVNRLVTVAATIVAALAASNCASLASGTHDGTLGSLTSLASVRTASVSEVMLGSNGTYIQRLLADRDSTFERWQDSTVQPVRVWIDSGSTVSGEQSCFPAAVREAFSEWSTTGIPLQFVYVARPGDADIRVRWTEHLDRKTGSTTWRTDHSGWMTVSEITLATHISSGNALDARGMRAIALHEVGHALGLSHSIDAHDIMAPLVRVDDLSATDRNTIKFLYSLPAGHVHP